MYKAGDCVIVRPDLTQGHGYSVYVNEEMIKYAGASAIITATWPHHTGHYMLDIDNGEWEWTSDLLFPDKEYEIEDDISILYG